MRLLPTIFIILLGVVSLCRAADIAAPRSLKWDDLIPESHRPSKILERYGRKFLDLSDPNDKKIYDVIQEVQEAAPVDTTLNNVLVAMQGYVVPLEGDGEALTEFLLVPEYGYCVHVPPPPRNQMLYIVAPSGGVPLHLFDTIRVVGRMQTGSKDSKFGEAGYTIQAVNIDIL